MTDNLKYPQPMPFQHDKSWDILTSILALKIPAKDAWNKLIVAHEQITPKTYWTELGNLDIAGEQKDIVEWLERCVTTEPIPDTVVAIWIGLVRLVDGDKEIPTIYFTGAKNYDKDDIDWACDPVYLPQNRYAYSEILGAIDEIASADEENYAFLDWILPIAYCSFTFDEIVRTKLEKGLFLKHKKEIFVSVGHDGGDFIDLSTIK